MIPDISLLHFILFISLWCSANVQIGEFLCYPLKFQIFTVRSSPKVANIWFVSLWFGTSLSHSSFKIFPTCALWIWLTNLLRLKIHKSPYWLQVAISKSFFHAQSSRTYCISATRHVYCSLWCLIEIVLARKMNRYCWHYV